MFDYNVKDSSLYHEPQLHSARTQKYNSIYIGMIRAVITGNFENIMYDVEVDYNGTTTVVRCAHMNRFYGIANYEEFNLKPHLVEKTQTNDTRTHLEGFDIKDGDVVVVSFLNGNPRNGVILGTLKHAKRPTALKESEISYLSEFNGLETKVKNDGTYKVTWKSKPTVGPSPLFIKTYDVTKGGSYYGFDTNGSFYVTDDAFLNKQFLTIKKDKNSICIVSGSNRIEIGKTDLAGSDSIGLKTKVFISQANEFHLTSSTTVKVKSDNIQLKAKNVAIGNDQVELISSIIDLIKELGNVIVTSPYGTCSPISTSPNWPKIQQLQELIKTLTIKITDPKELGSSSDTDNFTD